ncbi:phospholipid-transporting ATPase Dnf2p [[Candida] railenensis]|uniref:Phospholipid-transporting ATPase n=1 Tax=[Candida] railenensis TaxID=45579 RepID=A0A9P0VX58_9ASCO|nr:phospholipid-transporting ATPase Dnf2p [[Candida] railenensis]
MSHGADVDEHGHHGGILHDKQESLSNNSFPKDDRLENSESGSALASSSGSPGSPTASGYTLKDVFSAKPKTIKDKYYTFLFNKGLAPMPGYMKEIYDKTTRQVYVNWPIPDDLRHEGTNSPLFNYPRNKIRTTKYTPISFLPKNIFFQFENVANCYFLFLIILGAFQVFGVQSPGLAAVPLIVIVILTAIKDAFEDYKRASSDEDLNNSPIHLLEGLLNENVETGEVGGWRKFKKACTRATKKSGKALKKAWIMTFSKKKDKDQFIREERAEEENELRRMSTIVSDYSVGGGRTSAHHARESLQHIRSPAEGRSIRRSLNSTKSAPPTKFIPGTLLNPEKIKERKEDGLTCNFKNRHWKDIKVGDLVRVRANEEVPADIVIISTFDPEGNCYIETKNLDGETNLKNKTALHCGGSGNLKHANDLGATKFWVECDPPNGSLYTFKGTLHYEDYDESGELINPDEKEAINADNILLRGSTLRNTKWVIGLVVYTGEETKIMINSGITPTKKSRISKELNLSVIINFGFLFVLCFISGLINGLFYTKKNTSRLYFDLKPYGSTDAGRGVLAFFVSLIIYQALVPISLYISVEIIKTAQAFFIFSDIKMYYEKLDFPCVPKSWNISDDLGQIEYVFSDKTGTLTQNVMEFKKCSINGVSYGLAYTEAKQGLDKRDGKDPLKEGEKWKLKMDEDKDNMLANLTKYLDNDQLRPDLVTFCSNQFVEDTIIPEASKNAEQKSANESFMLALALCHTVVTEENPDDPSLRDFKAESPDEAALVAVARDIGIVFKERLRNSLVLEVYGKRREYKLLETIAFTSTRKRMSQIIETPEGKIFLLTKGADNVIFERLSQSENDPDVVSKTALHLENYANEGLRTLCITRRELDRESTFGWLKKVKAASESLDDDREDHINALYEELEVDLHLLGGTAIEDRLQDGVPDSISILSEAGIKLWVLTGDRIETAINIGFSCNLLENHMKLLVVRPDENDPDNGQYVEDLITKHLKENFDFGGDVEDEGVLDKLIDEARLDHSTPSTKFALIIDGAALQHVFSDEKSKLKDTKLNISTTLQKKFLLMGKKCKSVICCRVSPAQKASVVKIVRDSLNVMTLAIGDGANDVAMIQAANVGVGIAGEEGRQAVMSSDYAIGQFRFLTRLLLVHGRWSYKRLAEMIPCFFYKNVAFTLTCFWYGIYNDFDGSYLYEYTYLMFYNLAFTSLPVIFLAVLDQDVSDTVSLLVPQLYRSGILGLEWSQYKFIYYMIDGIFQSAVAFFFPYLLYYKGFQNAQGLPVDHRFWIGVVCACLSVTAVDLYILLRQYRWDWLTLLINAISILLVYMWTGAWSSRVYAEEFYKAGAQVLGTLSCWCSIFIGVLICLLPRFVFDFLMINFKPKDIDIIREQVRRGAFDSYPKSYDPTNKEDLELHRLGLDVPGSPDALEKNSNPNLVDGEKDEKTATPLEEDHLNPIQRTFKSIKRRATLSRKPAAPSNELKKPTDLETLRRQMHANGDFGDSRLSLERINTSHALPGLTQADTLLSYHTRNSTHIDNRAI